MKRITATGLILVVVFSLGLLACGSDITYDEKPVVVEPEAPRSPSDIQTSVEGIFSIKLRWKDNSANERGFFIERRLASNAAFSTVIPVERDITLFTDDDLEPNSWYCYRLKAYNSAGSSGYSEEVCEKTAKPPSPRPTVLPEIQF